MIPLDAEGHGRLVAATLRNAARFYELLDQHAADYLGREPPTLTAPPAALTFLPIIRPDTNIVCFVARPVQATRERPRPGSHDSRAA